VADAGAAGGIVRLWDVTAAFVTAGAAFVDGVVGVVTRFVAGSTGFGGQILFTSGNQNIISKRQITTTIIDFLSISNIFRTLN
jgi:hypothetical protein